MLKKLLILSALIAAALLAACGTADPNVPEPSFIQNDAGESADGVRTIRPYGQEISFDHLSLEQGLSQSTVNDILQDSRGLLWLATANGLNRYDGYNFQIFKHNQGDEYSLPGNRINVLYEDDQQQLWVGTDEGGIGLFDRDSERFDRIFHERDVPPGLNSQSIQAIFQTSDGDVWVGTDRGLDRFSVEGELINSYTKELDPTGNEAARLSISDLHQDGKSILWIGTKGGLVSFDPSNQQFQDHPISITDAPSNQVNALFEDVNGQLWIGTNGGLHFLQTASGDIASFRNDPEDNSSLSSNVVTDIIQDHFGAIWVATQDGLGRMSTDRQRFINYTSDPSVPQGLADNEIRSLFVDQAGVFWIGTTRNGVAKYDPYKAKFTRVGAGPRDPRMLSHPQVWTIFGDSSGDVWIGTSEGLDRLNPVTHRITRYRHDPFNQRSLPDSKVLDIIEDGRGRLWIATAAGLSRYLAPTDNFTTYSSYPADPNGLVADEINDLALDNQGNLWIGTVSNGLSLLDVKTGSFTNLPLEPTVEGSVFADQILTIFPKEDEDIFWIGTQNGLLRYDISSHSYDRYIHDEDDPDSLGHNRINVIQSGINGGLWLGTSDGLEYFDPIQERFRHYREVDGLSSNVVLGIETDSFGRLWISTDRGLSRFDPETTTFRNFNADDGLQSLEFNRGAHFKSDSGMMYFGGINGINIFQPESITDNPYAPPLIVTGFQVFNRPAAPGPDSPLERSIIETDAIRLKESDTVFTFELASLHFGTPEENQYAYTMEGFDDDWNIVGGRRFASYTNLPPGRYAFHAIATNNDGIWNPAGKTIDIVIPYPFWQQWWFIGLFAALILGGVFVGSRLRSRSSIRRTKELEDLVAARTREIEQRRQIAEGLREILVILNTSPSLEESLHYIVAQAARLTDAEDAIIFQYDEAGPVTVVATNPGGQIQYSLEPLLLNIVNGWVQEKLLDKDPLIISDLPDFVELQSDDDMASYQKHSALLGIPLTVGDDIYGGLLMLYSRVRAFDQDDLELGSTFADQAALAIANNRLRERVKQTATATERNRLARELHDAVTQTLFSASLIAETLAPTWENDPEEGRQLLQDLRQLTRGALAEMRTLLMELRPATLEEANLGDLLYQLSEAFMGRSGIPVKINAHSQCELPINVRIALYRIAQESLNNVVKHARAENVEVMLTDCLDGEGVDLSILDDGRGFDPDNVPGHHLGLNIIRERANAIGARLVIDSEINKGTKVSVHWMNGEAGKPV